MLTSQEFLHHWIEQVNAGAVDALCALYDEHALLIPTFSNHLLSTAPDIRRYFEQLSARPGLALTLHDKTVRVQPFVAQSYAISGIYCWRFQVDDEPLAFEARFTYLADLGAARPILHHHSSQIPRSL